MHSVAEKNAQKVIVGLGQTGLSYARYLHKRKLPFKVVDSRTQPPGLEALQKQFPQVSVELGEFQENTLMHAEELLLSPGVDMREPALAKAIGAAVPVTGDINIFAHQIEAPIIAVTGSNAKSTVVSLLGAMAKNAGLDVAVAGNIGKPVLDLLDEKTHQLYVLEISSFQLETTTGLGAEVACVLNISADHMDRYASMQDYHEAKHRIFQNCRQAVVNRNDPLTVPLLPNNVRQWRYGLDQGDINEFGLLEDNGKTCIAFSKKSLMPVEELALQGRHNLLNALASLALGHAAGLDMQAMLQTLREFRGLPHRCQYITEIKGVQYYNDSKGTNVGASIAAIQGLGGRNNVVLLAGGEGKGADFSELQGALSEHGKLLIAFGKDADQIQLTLAETLPVIVVNSLQDAVVLASETAQAGDIVLLSPACASFDMFKNFEHRGEVFIEAVEALH
ncbi:MAG: UDP-N-acetylmuramoyl-L-alanine--D-glutamate ligase [Gammaproteobacteria bacterium]|nr:UDP-N-acetylmuramoyl-L-alanine--D-glutamate ligase [Gammaproteobacteria bacterium]